MLGVVASLVTDLPNDAKIGCSFCAQFIAETCVRILQANERGEGVRTNELINAVIENHGEDARGRVQGCVDAAMRMAEPKLKKEELN